MTQLYKVDEDRQRGDRTVAVVWGPRACFLFAEGCVVLGGAAMLTVLWLTFGVWDVALVGLGLLVELVAIVSFAARYDPRQILANYRRVMRLNTLSAGGLSLYLLGRLVVSAPVWR